MAGIIVGVDGSHDAHRALEWAMQEAAARHAPLTVMTVHQVAASGWIGPPYFLPANEPAAEQARQAAEEAVAKAAAQLGESQPVSVTVRAVSGSPAQELIEASRDADLLVVGSRGGGGFARLVLGSVSEQVARHARCPVVVVPGPR
ncbi:MAG TPA: universal stress protein [Streptosporangiaceae bacterium]|nr:universal stress protein [Streptosporangiaceae bacterium]